MRIGILLFHLSHWNKHRVQLQPKIISYCWLSSGWLVFPFWDEVRFNRHLFITILSQANYPHPCFFHFSLFFFHPKFVCSTTLEFITLNEYLHSVYYFLPLTGTLQTGVAVWGRWNTIELRYSDKGKWKIHCTVDDVRLKIKAFFVHVVRAFVFSLFLYQGFWVRSS